MPDEYPHRPQYFCCQYTHALLRSKLGRAVSGDRYKLLSAIVNEEDHNWYREPARFSDAELCELMDFALRSLVRHRAALVNLGLLHYEPGVRGRKAVYWVEGEKIVKVAMKEPKRKAEKEVKAIQCQVGTESYMTWIVGQIGTVSLKPTDPIVSQIGVESGVLCANLAPNQEPPLIRETLEDPKKEITPASPSCSSAAVVVHEMAAGSPPAAPESSIPPPAVAESVDSPPAPQKASAQIVGLPAKVGDPFPMFDVIEELTGMSRKNSGGRIAKIATKLVKAGISPIELQERFPLVLRKYGQAYQIKGELVEIAAIERYWHWLREPPKGIPINTVNSNSPAARSAKAVIDAADAADGERPF